MMRESMQFDQYGCFHIKDFQEGDNVLVKCKKDRVRGIVEGTNFRRGLIVYRDINDKINSANINDIILLQKPEPGWMK